GQISEEIAVLEGLHVLDFTGCLHAHADGGPAHQDAERGIAIPGLEDGSPRLVALRLKAVRERLQGRAVEIDEEGRLPRAIRVDGGVLAVGTDRESLLMLPLVAIDTVPL